MIKEDTILDIKDNLNAIFFCLENELGDLEVPSAEIIGSIDSVKKSLSDDVYRLRASDLFEGVESKRISDIVKGKLSSRISLLYRVDELRNRLKSCGEVVRVSQNVMKNINANV